MAKRVLAVLLCVLMVLALATGCSSGDSGKGSGAIPLKEDGSIDLSQTRDIRIAIGQNTFITNYDDNYLTNLLEEKYNCNITMDVLPAGEDGKAKLQLMINGGDDLPDVFSYSLDTALMYQYGSNGTFLALNEYYENEKIMPNFNAIESEEDKTNMLSSATSADGNIYCLTMFQPEEWNLTPYRMYINTTWLDNLGLEMPTTTDELYDVLNAFANNDPNGNGTKDEIAVFAYYTDNGGGYGNNVILPIINSFVFTGTTMSGLTLSEDGKTVIAPQTTDGWKEAMRYLNSLTQCGAILPDGSFAYDDSSFKGMLNYQGIGTEPAEEGKSINVVGLASLGSNSGQFSGSGTDENVNFDEYWLMPVPEGPEGVAYSPYAGYNAERYWFVTENAADPAFCVYLGDGFYDYTMTQIVRFGKEGNDQDWTADPQFCSDWYTQHTQLIEEAGFTQPKESYSFVQINVDLWSTNNNTFWHNQQPRYLSLEVFNTMGTWYDPETFVYYRANELNPTSKEYYYEAHPQYVLPLLTYTDEEQAQITETQVEFPELIEEWTMRFITGESNVDTDWDAYIDALNGSGLQEYIAASQAAYERSVYYTSNFQ